jgi:hypothetical protein
LTTREEEEAAKACRPLPNGPEESCVGNKQAENYSVLQAQPTHAAQLSGRIG